MARQPKTASLEAIRKAQQLLDECDVRSLPVNLVSLARHQGIQQIKEMDTRLDGQLLELEDGGYEIILSKNASVTRKRFTLAHEIAHTLLFAGQDSEDLGCGEQAVEELCNTAAAEILIPSRFLQKTFPRDKEITVESFLEVTRLFECSLEAAAWKLLNSGLIEGALLIWRIKTIRGQQQGLELTSIPQTWGFQSPISRGMELHPGDSLWQALMSDESRLVELRDSHSGQSYQGECYRLNKIFLVLIRTGARYQDRAVRERRTSQGKLAF